MSKMKLIISFIERGQGNDLAKFYAEYNVSCNFRSVGMGTASSDLLDVLGIGSSEKDVIFSLASAVNAERLMNRLSDKLRNIREKGIVFSMVYIMTETGVQLAHLIKILFTE